MELKNGLISGHGSVAYRSPQSEQQQKREKEVENCLKSLLREFCLTGQVCRGVKKAENGDTSGKVVLERSSTIVSSLRREEGFQRGSHQHQYQIVCIRELKTEF